MYISKTWGHLNYFFSYFINVDAKDTEMENAAAELKSPLIKVTEQPVVCLKFFFELKVTFSWKLWMNSGLS